MQHKKLFDELVKLAATKAAIGGVGGYSPYMTHNGWGGYGGANVPMIRGNRWGSWSVPHPGAMQYAMAGMGRDLPNQGIAADYGRHMTDKLQDRAPEYTQGMLDRSQEAQGAQRARAGIDTHQSALAKLRDEEGAHYKGYADARDAAKSDWDTAIQDPFARARLEGRDWSGNFIGSLGSFFAGGDLSAKANKSRRAWETAPDRYNTAMGINARNREATEGQLGAAQSEKAQLEPKIYGESEGIRNRAVGRENFYGGAAQDLTGRQIGAVNRQNPSQVPITPQQTPKPTPITPGIAQPPKAPAPPMVPGGALSAGPKIHPGYMQPPKMSRSVLPNNTFDGLVSHAARNAIERYVKIANAQVELLLKAGAETIYRPEVAKPAPKPQTLMTANPKYRRMQGPTVIRDGFHLDRPGPAAVGKSS